MGAHPIAFCVDELPRIFARAKSAAESRASAGDRKAASRLADVAKTRVLTRVTFEGDGGGDVYLVTERGELHVSRERPATPALLYALALPLSAAAHAIDLLDEAVVDVEILGEQLSTLATTRALQLFGMYKYGFHVCVDEVPHLGSVTMRIGLGRDLPDAPELTLRAHYGDLEQARQDEMPPQELFGSGKLVITGDTAKAMMLAMTLSQLR
jgi:hypothetical protein